MNVFNIFKKKQRERDKVEFRDAEKANLQGREVKTSDRYADLPCAISPQGKLYIKQILIDEAFENQPQLMKSLFATLHCSRETAEGGAFDNLEIPNWYVFVPYITSLFKQMHSENQLEMIQSVLQEAKEGSMCSFLGALPFIKEGKSADYIESVYQYQRKKIASMEEGQSIVLLTGEKHAFGVVLTLVDKDNFHITFVDPVGWHVISETSGRQKVLPFYTLGPVSKRKIENQRFIKDLIHYEHGLLKLTTHSEFLTHFTDLLELNLLTDRIDTEESLTFAAQNVGVRNCQAKCITTILKFLVGDAKKARRVMSELKELDLRRFQRACGKDGVLANDPEAQKLLKIGIEEFEKRKQKKNRSS